MRYRLAVYKNYEYIEPNNYMIPVKNMMSGNENELNHITEFTTLFTDNESLMEYMIFFGFVNEDFKNGDFVINYYRNKTSFPQKLKYGITFENDLKYFDTKYIINYIINHITDNIFMEKFISKYEKLLKVEYFKNSLNEIIEAYYVYKVKGILPKYYEEYVNEFISLYTFSYNNNKQIFNRLRELAMFIKEDENKKKVKPLSKFQDRNYLINLKMKMEHLDALLKEDLTDEEYDALTIDYNKNKREIDLIERK